MEARVVFEVPPWRTRFISSLRLRLLLILAHFLSPPSRPASLVSTSVRSILDVELRQGINLSLVERLMVGCGAKIIHLLRRIREKIP